MKKMFGLLIILNLILLGIQFGFKFIEKGHEINYIVDTNENSFEVKEIYTVNTNKEKNNYYFEISINNTTFDYQTFKSFNMASKIVKDIYYFKGGYECILPVFMNQTILSDIICKKGDNYYNYRDLRGNAELDNFANGLTEYGYKIENYENNSTEVKSVNGVTYYNNLIGSHYVALESYKGLNVLNKSMYRREIFSKDVYSKSISGYVGKYYIVADYMKDTKFNVFTIVSLIDGKVTKISYDYDISLDSYILGTHENSIYIMDRSTMKEYELNVATKTIIEVGNKEIGIKIYKNNNFEYDNAYNVVNNNLTFASYNGNTFNNSTYSKIIKTGIQKSGYYYIFEKVGSSYKVYRSNIQNGINKTYLFTTTSLNNFISKDDTIYYQDGEYIKRYSDESGIKTILKYSELKFNDNIKLGLYAR